MGSMNWINHAIVTVLTIFLSNGTYSQCEKFFEDLIVPDGYIVNSQSVMHYVGSDTEIELSCILYAGIDYQFRVLEDVNYFSVFLKNPAVLHKEEEGVENEQVLVTKNDEESGVFNIRVEVDQRVFVKITGNKNASLKRCRGLILLEKKK